MSSWCLYWMEAVVMALHAWGWHDVTGGHTSTLSMTSRAGSIMDHIALTCGPEEMIHSSKSSSC